MPLIEKRTASKVRRAGKERREGRTFYLMEAAEGSVPVEDTSTMIINDSTKINSLLLRIGALPVIHSAVAFGITGEYAI